VTIGEVTFDWEPTLRLGAAALPGAVRGPRGSDPRLEGTDRFGAAGRLAAKRARRRRTDAGADAGTGAEPGADGVGGHDGAPQ